VQVHDIEDLVTAGKQQQACPYFTARALAEHAEVVFCPYNYIIDPVIRSSVGINMTGAVLIFDEAHNIEDTAREAASTDITLSDLQEASIDILGAFTLCLLCGGCGSNRTVLWCGVVYEDAGEQRLLGATENNVLARCSFTGILSCSSQSLQEVYS
jgi:Rad3-related DNA helicase